MLSVAFRAKRRAETSKGPPHCNKFVKVFSRRFLQRRRGLDRLPPSRKARQTGPPTSNRCLRSPQTAPAPRDDQMAGLFFRRTIGEAKGKALMFLTGLTGFVLKGARNTSAGPAGAFRRCRSPVCSSTIRKRHGQSCESP